MLRGRLRQPIFQHDRIPTWPRTLGYPVAKTLRPSLGILKGYYGLGRRIRRRRVAHKRGGKLTVGKVLHGVNNFLKKSKLISTVAPSLIKQYVPKQYKGIPTQAIASQLVRLGKKEGYGRRMRHKRMHHKRKMMMGGNKGLINLRKTKNTLLGIDKFLRKSKVLSKIAKPIADALPQYKQYSDPALQILKNVGYGRRKMHHKKRGGALRGLHTFKVGYGRQLGLYGNTSDANTRWSQSGLGRRCRGGNAPFNRYVNSSF